MTDTHQNREEGVEQAQHHQRDALKAYVTAVAERFSSYHDHKETMAYSGITLYAAAAAAALTSAAWPPPWGSDRHVLAVIAFSILWLSILVYLHFQLRRRRWAALRIAGCDWLLVSWLPDAPVSPRCQEKKSPSRWLRIADFFWPLARAVTVVDRSRKVYPEVLEDAWRQAEARGTDAIKHERLIYAVGWLLFLAVVSRTFLTSVNAP